MSRRTTRSFFVLFLVCLSLIQSRTEGLSCGICGVDVICKDRYPICSTHQIIALDYCGCCLVCKNILELGEECSKDIDNYAVCKSGLECVNSKCADVKTPSG